MKGGYAKAGVKTVRNYGRWSNVNVAPYPSATHGNRFVNNYANSLAAIQYSKFEKSGKMPTGAVLAKDSFVVRGDGKTGPGPLFVMEKMKRGFSKASGDWRYTLVMPNGVMVGATKGKGSKNVKFCYECHMSMGEETDSMLFVPKEHRVKY